MIGLIRTSLFYHLLASIPLLMFAIGLIVVRLTRMNRIPLPWKWLTVCLIVFLIVSAVAYLILPIILDDAEAAVAGASAQAMRGLPIYPDSSAVARYGLVYGPMASLWHIPFYYVFGKNIFSFKLAGVLAFLFCLFGLYRICRKYSGPGPSLLGLGFACVLFFQYIGYDYWGRSDPLIVALIVAAIWVTIDGHDWAVVMVGAAAVGIMPNLKISGVAYLLPLLGFVVIRKGWRIAAWIIAGAACVFVLPFALPQVSFPNYLYLVRVISHQGFNPDFFSRNIQYTVILLIPLVFLAVDARRASIPQPPAQLYYFGLIGCGMPITCILGSKVGAGNYHLFPYLVPILHLYFWRRSALPPATRDLAVGRFALPWVATLLFYSTAHVVDYVHVYQFAPRAAEAISEIRKTEEMYKGQNVEVGMGDISDDPRLSYGSVSALDGEPYNLNFQAVRDMQLGGNELPESTLTYIRDCGTAVWLIPKNQLPFTTTNQYYQSNHPAFGDTFIRTFASRYRKVDSMAEFDVWLCGPSLPGHN